MINPIIFLSILSPEMIDEGVTELEKCNISGKIKKIEIKKTSDCLVNLDMLISGEKGYYLVKISKAKEADCSFDGIYTLYGDKTLPKVGDNLDLLVDKNHYLIISDNKVGKGIYKLISGNNSEGNNEICESNTSFVGYYSNYFHRWV